MKICTKCGKNWQDEFNICPICGSDLKPEETKTASVSLGNSNAVSGGIHNTDDHSIKTDNSVKNDNSTSASHNTTNSHNTTTTTNTIYNGNVTRIERDKTPEELLKERKLKYRECCKKVLADGLLTREERIWLEEQRAMLDLSAEMASHILNEVSKSHQHTVMSMGTVQRIQFNNFKRDVEGNMVQNIKRLMPPIKVIATKFQEEELQFLYHMVLAALFPQECVDTYTKRTEDKYWLTFWTYVALHKLGDVANAENVMIDLGKWQGLMPDENLVILGAFGSLIEGEKEIAQELYTQAVTNEYSSLLTNLTEVIVAILNYEQDNADVLTAITRNRFYVDNFLHHQYEQEVERCRQETEEKRRREEEERKRIEAERLRKEEEERKRKEERLRKEAEEKARREAEEKARRDAEEKRRREEEEHKRIEAERLRKEEEERKRKEEERLRKEAEDKARREAEEKARRDAEEKRRREEEERKRIEAERLRKEEEERKRKEEERLRKEAEEKVRREAEEKARLAAEWKRRRDEEERKRLEEERKRREEEGRKRKEAEEKRRKDEEARKRIEASEEACREAAEIRRKIEEEYKRKKEEEVRLAAERPRFCRKCGNPLKPDAIFCNKCGTKINR